MKKGNKVYLISFYGNKPGGSTIADRADHVVAFSKGGYWYRGVLSIDELFKIMKPHLKKEKGN